MTPTIEDTNCMSCMLGLSGEHFDVDAFLVKSGLEPHSVWHKGEPRFKTKPEGKKLAHSGLSICTSEAGFDELQQQIEETIQYLENNHDKLAFRLSENAIEDAVLDFGIYLRIGANDIEVQCDRFPHKLVKLAGELGLDIELSLYGHSFEK